MSADDPSTADAERPVDFIRQIIRDDLEAGRHQQVVTRFPPEPNGFLHIGHAKSICLNFGVAGEFAGQCNLRFDDTNPAKEDQRYVDAIEADVRWLGFEWAALNHASDYFEQIFAAAVHLIEQGLAYVDSQDGDTIREQRGTLTDPGTNSPFRGRSVAENLELFQRMRAGEFADGEHVLRAKIDMASPNINLRDPVLYRIRKVAHQRTGDAWPIYPMYDFTHALSDAIEGITHSLCTLEFEDHRPLYDWVTEHCPVNWRPRQIEFSRLGLEYTVMSKRLLNQLVDDGHVDGWDDPRMPTIAGMRRRGVTPAAIRDFCHRVGVTKQDNTVEMSLLEHCIRADLEEGAPRAMAVLDPLKVTITNWDGGVQDLEAPWHPKREDLGSRTIHFGRELWVERGDFAEEPPRKWKRLTPGANVRLRYGYIIRVDEVVKDAAGEVVELKCHHYPDSRSGQDTSGIKAKGVIHFVCAETAVPAEVRLYDRLFRVANPGKTDFADALNPDSLALAPAAQLEAALADAEEGARYQFERLGWFCRDRDVGGAGEAVWNRTVSLRDSWK